MLGNNGFFNTHLHTCMYSWERYERVIDSACLKNVFFFKGGNDKCFQAAFGESRTSPGGRAIEGGKQTIKEKLLRSETKGQYLVLIIAAIGETVLVKEITQRIWKVQMFF